MTPLLLVAVLAQAPETATAAQLRDMLYRHSCYTGVSMAQAVLPKVDSEDALMSRGFLSCDGSLARLKGTGELDREKEVVQFACGYAIGAMFAKYGLAKEIEEPVSPRAVKAMNLCVEAVRKQHKAEAVSDRPAVRTCFSHAFPNGERRTFFVAGHQGYLTLLRPWLDGRWGEPFVIEVPSGLQTIPCPVAPK